MTHCVCGFKKKRIYAKVVPLFASSDPPSRLKNATESGEKEIHVQKHASPIETRNVEFYYCPSL